MPFRFGAPVEPPWFCDREAELDVLTARIEAGIHVFVLSPRRYGKTSLLARATDVAAAAGVRCAYANLLLCSTEVELASAIVTAVVRGVLGPAQRALHGLEEVLRHLRVAPRVSMRPDGAVEVSLDPLVVGGSWLGVIEDAVGLLERAAQRRPAVLMLDEFQVVASIGPKGVGGAFKALADSVRHASLVFCGSHLSTMEKLTRGSGAPLAGMGERLVLDVVPEPAMVDFVVDRVAAGGKQMAPAVAAAIYAAADGVPNYVQQLALAAFEAAGRRRTVDNAEVAAGLGRVVERQAGDFAERVELLAGSQQRVLKALSGQPTSAVYAKAFLDAVAVANANAVTTALRVLNDRELVQRRNRVWTVADPFLRHWLRTRT